MEVLFGTIAVVFAVWFFVWFFIQLPYRMAEERGRDGYVWVAISLVGSPFLAIVLLLIAGHRMRDDEVGGDSK